MPFYAVEGSGYVAGASLSGERWVSPDSGGVTLERVVFFASL